MPVAMTYNSLLADLRSYIERGTISDTSVFEQLPKLINLAERQIAREVKILGFLEVVTNTMSAGTSVITKPDGWRETASFNFGTGTGFTNRTPLFPRAYEYCRSYWPDPSQTDQPKFYSDYGYTHWLIVPTPALDYPFEVNYWQLPNLLDDSNQTNWLTDYAPNTLLYCALLQAAPYLKNDERIQTWEHFFNRNMAALDGEDLQRIIDRSVSRQET